jgi:hypothetical protein
MTRLVQRLKATEKRLVKPVRDWLLARLRAHMALAVHGDLHHVVLHVTAERVTLAAELTQRLAAELAPLRRQLDDLNLCNDGLLREVMRLQREVRELSEGPLSSLGDSPHPDFGDARHARAA